jgi:hypothetical protein
MAKAVMEKENAGLEASQLKRFKVLEGCIGS